uniref:A-kinase anchor protein 7-like phosphoesterase domain-containing protein n=1 Tax=Leptobrachium leishanense TaxID=445787 RepID=A0A8C5MAZ8_9ANUR
MQGTRIVLRTSVWRLAFRAAFIRSQRDVARLSTPRARYLATSFPIGMEARTPPLAETPDPSLGVENPAQQEEKEKPDHTPDEDTQKKKKMRIKKKKLKTKAYQSRSMDLGLAEMPFSQADIRAAFEIPNPHSKKAKNKRKIKDQSENDNEDASKKIKRVNYFVSLPITNAKILGDIQTFQDAVVQKDGRLSRALSRKGSFHITLFVMRLENEDEVNLAISALLECKRPVEKVLQEKELVFSFHGVADFKNEVVYGKMTEDEYKSSLKEITEIMEKIFKEKGVHTEGKKGFIPHLTFMKMSRAPKLRKQGLKKINPNLYKDFQDHCFGKETLFRLDLCSMLKQRQACGYYHTEASIFFGSKIQEMSGTYKHKSGAVKRKLSRQRRENEASTSKIDTFFGKKSEIPKEDTPGEITDEPMELVPEEVIRDPETESSVEICLPNEEDSLEPLPATEDYFHYGQDLHKAGITMEMFWDFHPNQSIDNTPFNDKVVYYRKGIRGSNVHRRFFIRSKP